MKTLPQSIINQFKVGQKVDLKGLRCVFQDQFISEFKSSDSSICVTMDRVHTSVNSDGFVSHRSWPTDEHYENIKSITYGVLVSKDRKIYTSSPNVGSKIVSIHIQTGR